jgi:hypothetical protein
VKHSLYLEGDALARCRKSTPHAKGALSFELRVLPDGSVKTATAREARYPKLAGCLSHVMRKLRFAAPPRGREAVITVPYQLEP